MNLLNLFVTEAHAAAPSAAQGSGTGYEGLLMLAAMFAIFYFLLIRPQAKRAKAHRQLIDTLALGDQVITAGGIHGKVAALQESVVVLEIASGVKVRINRTSIASSKTGGEQAD